MKMTFKIIALVSVFACVGSAVAMKKTPVKPYDKTCVSNKVVNVYPKNSFSGKSVATVPSKASFDPKSLNKAVVVKDAQLQFPFDKGTVKRSRM
jgi:hypothetical protein